MAEKFHVLIIFILTILFELPAMTNSQSSPILQFCPSNTTYTTTSPFASDLANLLNNLSSTASISPSPFFTTTNVGSAYGLAQCRPDVSSSDCTSCIDNSAAAASSNSGCPNLTSAAIRFDYCVLIYSDAIFFSQLQLGPTMILENKNNASDVDAFDKSLVQLMNELAAKAEVNELKYSAGIGKYSESGKIYGMVQCNRDLSTENCEECLNLTLNYMPEGKIGGQVVYPSCTLRFETSDFFGLSLVPPPPSPLVAPAPGIQVGDGDGGGGGGGEGKNTVKIALAISIPAAAALVFAVALYFYFSKRRPTKRTHYNTVEETIREESLFFDLKVLKSATNNFSDENKLGGGGFGFVYKGILKNGQEIAVKRLSKSSSQGFEELRNEVALVARLQHKNLVRLLGFCLQQQEKLLVYEYLPNSSLDRFLFDQSKSGQLDWAIRYKIIEGIGRGLLYLHVDSRLKIIHRDLKASNILLDMDMNPKISDFGLAKLFTIDETHGNTNRIAGTFGYMAPEYALLGKFSTKSDVYSYGILILEIITGTRNGGYEESGSTDLLSIVIALE